MYYDVVCIEARYMLTISVATLKNWKNLDGPMKKTKKTQGQISMELPQLSGKNPTFFRKTLTFPEEMFFSSTLIFKCSPSFGPKATANSLLLPKNHLNKYIFWYNVKEKPEEAKFFEKP